MSVTLDISDQLAALLRTLATEQGVSVEALGQHALELGLHTLASGSANIVDIQPPQHTLPASAHVNLPSPTIVSGNVRPLHVTFEPDPEASQHAH